MTITFFSNFFNHHQKPICDEFVTIKNVEFKFVSTIEMPESFKKSGYVVPSVSYEIKAYKNHKQMMMAKELISTSDVIIFGAVDSKPFNSRIKDGKLTFKYSERIFKRPKSWMNPKSLLDLLRYNTFINNKNFFLLCAGGFVANDFSKIFAFPNNRLKWGYFTKTNKLDLNEIILKKSTKTLHLLFIARLIPYKQPQLIVNLATELKKENISFNIDIVGVGPLQQKLELMINKNSLNNEIKFKGNMSNNNVLNLMQKADALLFTSNKEEGWGAVANEAMANGCPIIISNEIGAAPFLIQNNWNGLVFESKNVLDLKKQVLKIYRSTNFKTNLIKNAYYTISKDWSPKNAAEQFVSFCDKQLSTSKEYSGVQGPMSKAKLTSYKWYK